MSLVLGLIMVQEPSPPSAHQPELDKGLEAICLKAMAKNVDDRYATMEAFAGALGCLIGSVVAYAIGARGGRPFVERYGKYVLVRRSDLDRAVHQSESRRVLRLLRLLGQ